jgi:hypothetical protein
MSLVAGLVLFLLNLSVPPFASALVLNMLKTGLAEVALSMLMSDPVSTRSSSPASSYFIVQSEPVPNINV